jgi:hypothetical protein
MIRFVLLASSFTWCHWVRHRTCPASRLMMGALADGVASGTEPTVATRDRRRARPTVTGAGQHEQRKRRQASVLCRCGD